MMNCFFCIAELNLVSAGFTDARLLSRKFVTLYTLCRDLLSKQVCFSNKEKKIFFLCLLYFKGTL